MVHQQKGPFWSIALSFKLFVIVWALINQVRATPPPTRTLSQRTYPYFPEYPPSCKICEQSYPEINSCADAAVVLENVTQIIFNPAGFVDVIQCACADTFQAAFPQCVDCFIMTNQTTADGLTPVLKTNDLPSLVSGMREVCSLFSVLMGGVASTNRQLPSQTPISVSEIQNAALASVLLPDMTMMHFAAAGCMFFSVLYAFQNIWI